VDAVGVRGTLLGVPGRSSFNVALVLAAGPDSRERRVVDGREAVAAAGVGSPAEFPVTGYDYVPLRN
jgi:hypothetical protein